MDTDRNLLFGVLALQADVITTTQFIDACTLWASRKDMPLADLLAERGWLSPPDRSDVERLVRRKLHKHVGDARASLAEAAPDPIRRSLAALHDPDVQQSLAELPSGNGTVVSGTMAYQPQGRERYLLTQLHAQGGIGQVWQAHDTDLGRDVALKELRPEREDQPAIRARFLEEGRVTGQLEHPGIVPVYELARDPEGGRPFYTMRFIRGRTLQEAAQSYHKKRATGQVGPLELRELLTAFVAVCNAVAYAHSRGVIHRDLKPQNVILGDFGEVMVLDWGLAKRLDRGEKSDEEAANPEAPSGQTVQGQILGTPAYMAPEQAEGRMERIDRLTDVYGLGAVLYEVLTGRPPFTAEDTHTVLKRVVRESPILPQQLAPGTPAALAAVCLKALAKTPQERYPSAKALAEEVRCYLADEPVVAFREPLAARLGRGARRHKPVVAGVAASLVAAVVALSVSTALIRQQQKATLAEKEQAEAQRDRADRNFGLARKAVDDYLSRVTENKRLREADFHPLRRELLLSALPFYEQFVQQAGDDPSLQTEQGRAYKRLGDVLGLLGKQQEARASYEAMQAIFAELARLHPEVAEYRRELAQSHSDLGSALSGLKLLSDAEQEHRRALAERQRLVEEFPAVPGYRHDMAVSHFNLGDALWDLGHPDGGEREHRRAIALHEDLVRDFPTVADYRQKLAWAHNNLGNMFQTHDRAREAEQALRRAMEVKKELVRDFPSVPDYRHDLAQSHGNLGNVLRDLRRFEESVEEHRRAIDMEEQLARHFHSVPEHRFRLARTHNNLGNVLRDLKGREREAGPEYARALALFEQLAAEYPESPEYAWGVANTRALWAGLLAEQGDHRKAAAEADRVDERAAGSGMARYNMACAWSVIAAAARRDMQLSPAAREQLSGEYAARAVAWLAKAREAGYFRAGANVQLLKTDSDLEPLRGRPDFDKFLAELKKPEAKGQ